MPFIDKILFSETTPRLLKKTLDLHLQRNSVIASNIANADTPGYKAVDIKFEEQLRTAIGSGDQIKMKATHNKHFTSDISQINKITPTILEESDPARPDGNNVRIEKEMFKLVETQLKYNAIAQAITKRGSILRYAIEGSK